MKEDDTVKYLYNLHLWLMLTIPSAPIVHCTGLLALQFVVVVHVTFVISTALLLQFTAISCLQFAYFATVQKSGLVVQVEHSAVNRLCVCVCPDDNFLIQFSLA